jgi:hypothetical protein
MGVEAEMLKSLNAEMERRWRGDGEEMEMEIRGR